MRLKMPIKPIPYVRMVIIKDGRAKKGDKVIRVTLLIMVSYMAVKLWLDTFNT